MADNMQDKLISVLLVVLISTMLAASVIGAYIASRLTVSPSDVYAEVKGLREELHSENGWKRIALLSYAKDKDAVAAVDASGVIVAWSRGAEEMFGVSAEQTVGGGILFAIIPELRDEHIESFRRAMTQPGRHVHTNSVRCEALHADGSRFDITLTTRYVPGVGAVTEFRKS